MKTMLSLVLVTSLAASAVSGETITEKNAGRAAAVIDAAVEAHGGAVGIENAEIFQARRQ